jgi:L-2,4-diaminobutyrate decarboxylase
MGMSSNAIERVITQFLSKQIGYNDQSGGFLTSGGTLANLTAMLSARAYFTNVWEDGTNEKLAIMVSEEAHYCIDRAARIMGLGSEGIIKIPVNESLQMEVSMLELAYHNALSQGYKVFAIVSSACSTSSGSYDNINAIADFAEHHKIWHHVDGAHGGAVLFSKKHRYKIDGIQRANSITIDWHKMMMIPSLTTSLIYKNQETQYDTFHQKAQYLWANNETQDWFNSGKRTFECTKLMMSIKVYSFLKSYGHEMIEQYVDETHELAIKFYDMLIKAGYECAVRPESNIVCFRRIDDTRSIELQNQIHVDLVKSINSNGKFYIVQTKIREKIFMRVSLMNPLTKEIHLKALMEELRNI